MLGGPLGVGSLGVLVEFVAGPVEDEPDVYVWVAGLDADVLGAV